MGLSDTETFDQLLLIDKAKTWTSFDVVNKIRSTLRIKKVGHAGTLDPLATGLLLVGVGKYTKKLNELQDMDKEYTGIIEIGKTTPSYDLETEFDSETKADHITTANVQAAAKSLIGEIEQIPPVYSAIRINGMRAYQAARQKLDVKMKPRHVSIYDFDIERKEGDEVFFRIKCSKGTYIRSIARDIGQYLEVGAYLKELRRTRIGDYHVNDARSIDEQIILFTNESN